MRGWQRPDCPAMEVEHCTDTAAFRDALLAEARLLTRDLGRAGAADARNRLRERLRSRLELLAWVVASGTP